MGCRESKDRDAGNTDPAWNGANFRDPEECNGDAEEAAHLAAWKDSRTRQRIENNLRDQYGSSALRATLASSLHMQEADEDDARPQRGVEIHSQPSHAQPGSCHTQQHASAQSRPSSVDEQTGNSMPPDKLSRWLSRVGDEKDDSTTPSATTGTQPSPHQPSPRHEKSVSPQGDKLSRWLSRVDGGKGGHQNVSDRPTSLEIKQEDVTPKDSLLEKKRRIEQEQARARRREMLSVSPACWKALADEQRYQYADDLLSEAMQVEEEENGRSERCAQLCLALAALFDDRSNLDQTGQQQALSYAAVGHARRAVADLTALGWAPAEELEVATDSAGRAEALRRADVLSGALLLGGKSLCNVALDGDAAECSAVDAMAEAQAMLSQAVALRKRSEHAGLAEAVMALGYVHYCRAGSLGNAFNCSTRSVLASAGDVDREYRAALRTYHEALQLFAANGHPDGRDTIRPMCNIALTYKTVGASDPAALQHAQTWYARALALQEALFGAGDLSRRISADLEDVRKQLKPVSPGGAPQTWGPPVPAGVSR